jgi:hypothetical protein
MMAQAIRAILLASATPTFVGRRSINGPSHGRFSVPVTKRLEFATSMMR